MTRKVKHLLVGFAFFGSGSVWSTPEYDFKHSYKNIAAAVINTDKEPVHGEHIETEMINALRREVRFEFSDKGYLYLKEGLRNLRVPTVEVPEDSKLLPLKSLLSGLAQQGVPAAILAEVSQVKEKYQILMMMVSTMEAKVLFHSKSEVDNPNSLDSFALAGRDALNKVLRGIPFEATVIKRDGYRVVLDRGRSIFRQGMELVLYSINEKDGQLVFEETGLIGISQVDDNLSFGKILAENKPAEITQGNKVRLPETPTTQLAPLAWANGDRSPTALFEESFEVYKGKLGVVHANVGPSLLSVNTTTQGTTGQTEFSDSSLAPRGAVRAELWLTSRYFTELGLGYSFASTGVTAPGGQKQSVSTGLSDVRFQVGYRLNIFAPEAGPVVNVKLGYGSASYSFGTTANGLAGSHSDTSYAGLLVGGGVWFRVHEEWSGSFDLNTMIFPGVKNKSAASNIKASNVAAWDFGLRAIYNFQPDIDFEGKLFFQHHGADFTGDPRLLAVSQTVKGLLVGVNYYF